MPGLNARNCNGRRRIGYANVRWITNVLHKRAREQGVNPLVYWLVRAVFQPFFHIYFRLSRIGREHIPAEGPVIVAANHRSFLDPFVIATMARRPMYYVAKKELFTHPVAGVVPQRARRVPGRPRRRRRGHDRDRQGDPRARATSC